MDIEELLPAVDGVQITITCFHLVLYTNYSGRIYESV